MESHKGLWRLLQIHLFHLDQDSLQAHCWWAIKALGVYAKVLRAMAHSDLEVRNVSVFQRLIPLSYYLYSDTLTTMI